MSLEESLKESFGDEVMVKAFLVGKFMQTLEDEKEEFWQRLQDMRKIVYRGEEEKCEYLNVLFSRIMEKAKEKGIGFESVNIDKRKLSEILIALAGGYCYAWIRAKRKGGISCKT